jgi:phospholipid/cholesterol/gamma-HCH transport system substrate-binding protein
MGIDYDFQRIGTTVSLEAFDYRKDIGINLRLSTEIQLWNVFYGRVELEDMIESRRNATFGVGLRFNDEDIKSLVGLLL